MRLHGRIPSPARAGMTLIEIMITTLLFSGILASLALVANSSQDAYRAATHSSAADTRARRALDRAASELVNAGQGLIFPNPSTDLGTSTLTFQQAQGLVGGVLQWSTPMRLELEYEPGELNNGLDDDSDGLIDEGRLVLLRDAGGASEQLVVLASQVCELFVGETIDDTDENGNGVKDERGFNIHQEGGVLTLRLCVEERRDGGQPVVRTAETSVRLRN